MNEKYQNLGESYQTTQSNTRLEVGKTYPTRDGRVAKVLSLTAATAKVSAERTIQETWDVFNDDGKARYHDVNDPRDLILPYRVRREIEYEGPKDVVDRYIQDVRAAKGYWESRYPGLKMTEVSHTVL